MKFEDNETQRPTEYTALPVISCRSAHSGRLSNPRSSGYAKVRSRW